MRSKQSFTVSLAAAALFLGAGYFYSAIAQDDDQSKAIKAEEFVKARPAALKRNRSTGRYKAPAKSMTAVNSVPAPGTGFVQVGVTLWRFRPSTTGDKT